MSKAEIYYCDIGDYLSREEKLNILREKKSFFNPAMNLAKLTPNEHGDWITSRNDAFQGFLPLASEKKFDTNTHSVFVVNSRGFETARDAWVYNFSHKAVLGIMRGMVEFYNLQIGKAEPDYDSTRISWSRSLLGYHKNGQKICFDDSYVMAALYRPFCKQHLYFGERIINVRGQFGEFFPTADKENLVIMVSGLGGNKDHSVFISKSIIDLNCLDAGTQCFPLCYYEQQVKSGKKKGLVGQFDMSGQETQAEFVRRDGISDFILKEARTRYGAAVKKEDIFYYVYGFLHNPRYRATFADDLKKALPRIPLVDKPDDFWTFSKAGRELAKLHLEYESVPPLPEVVVDGDRADCRVTKIRHKSKTEKDIIFYNQHITVSNIPAKAYEYVVNGKSAIEWVMERYQVKTDKDSGIENDPNLYAEETGQPGYILNLLLSVIAVSVLTVEIVEGLPEVVW